MVKSKRNLLLIILSVVFAFTLISFVSAKPVSADAVPVITMKESAEVRFDPDRSGLRFTAYVAEGVELDEDTYAGIIVTRGTLDASDLTHDDDIIDIKAVKYDPKNNDPELGRAFNAVIYDIDAAGACGQVLTARAYLRQNGEYTYSSTVCVRSLAQVASKLLVEEDHTPEEIALLERYVNGANPVLKIGETVLEEGVTVDINAFESATVTVEPANISFAMYADSDNPGVSVDGTTISATTVSAEPQIVIVDIGSNTFTFNVNVLPWQDKNISSDRLADFDEEQYTSLVSLPSTSKFAVSHLDAEEAKAELGEGQANGGVLKLQAEGTYAKAKIPFNRSVNFNELAGFYIKLKHNVVDPLNLMIEFKDGSVSREITNYLRLSYVHTTDEMTILNFSHFDSKNEFYSNALQNLGEIDHVIIYAANQARTTFYIDEIGINSDPETYFIDFNEKSDIQKVFTNGTTAKILLPGDEGYPADKGATTGVLALNNTAAGIIFTPGRTVDGSKITKITVNMYVPNQAGEKESAIFLDVNNKTSFWSPDNLRPFRAAEYLTNGTNGLSIWPTNDKVSFGQATFDLTGALSAGPVHSIRVMRRWNPGIGVSTDSSLMYYIDSITYELAAE